MKNRLLWIVTDDIRVYDNPTFDEFVKFDKAGIVKEVIFFENNDENNHHGMFPNNKRMNALRSLAHAELKTILDANKIKTRLIRDDSPAEYVTANDLVIMTRLYHPEWIHMYSRIQNVIGKDSLRLVSCKYLMDNIVDIGTNGMTYKEKKLRKPNELLFDDESKLKSKPDNAIKENTSGKSSSSVTIKPKKFSKFYDTCVRLLPKKFVMESQNVQSSGLRKKALESLRGYDPSKYTRFAKASISSRSGSTGVSWALSIGVISPREVYNYCHSAYIRHMLREYGGLVVQDKHGVRTDLEMVDPLVRELIFRDYYAFASLWFLKWNMNDRLPALRNRDIKWKITTMKEYLDKIQDKHTPEVIRMIFDTLKKTGNISNYGRMIFATWTYDINADWRLGYHLFARELYDFDPDSNYWNWIHHSIQGLNSQWPARKYKIENIMYM